MTHAGLIKTPAAQAILLALWAVAAGASGADNLSFNRDILPILSQNCFQCHGPDAASRKADLRLDTREGATADLGGTRAIVPGRPDQSELILRVASEFDFERMPPEKSGKTLSADQIAKLRAWIAQGAQWGEHWAFVPPEKGTIPAVQRPDWVVNPIDAYVLARLERESLSPSPEADPVTLLRRLSLDITGLPPTLDEIDAFLSEDVRTAYPAAVERLLNSPHYGEKWARPWLDAAQYADSDGFEKDKPRQVWAWRDWVIKALNSNMPYDRFVREQIAGDLMPGAGRDQIVATGFLRNSMINEEGGIDPEQFRMEAMFNRMDVIGRAVLGLTINCAQCHDHKYDPLSQREYYQMLAYINNSHEACVTVFSDDEEALRREIHGRIAAMDEALRRANPEWAARFSAWEDELASQPRPLWRGVELSFDDSTAGGQKFVPRGDASYVASGYAPTRFSPKMAGESPVRMITAVRLDLLNDPNLPRGGPGRSVYGTCALTEFEMYVAPKDETMERMHVWERVKITSALADVNPPDRPLGPEYPQGDKSKAVTGSAAMAIDGDGNTAWTTDNGPDRRNQPRFVIFKLDAPLTVSVNQQLGFRLNQNHGGNNSDDNQTNNLGRFRISVTDAALLPTEAVPADIEEIISRPRNLRTPEQQARLFDFWMESRKPFPLAAGFREKLWGSLPSGTTQLVYREREDVRPTHRLDRGNFLTPAEVVQPGTPQALNPPPAHMPPNRLALAAWLTDPRAPTTARALVNRVWQGYFGVGLVDTPSDFGLQGSQPSHPELLDWLAVTFMESGWDVKSLHRMIVTSATYRQSSRVTPGLLERDPDNRLLARGARFRVDGEIVRDIALASSGLLNPQIGGPSVYPPAPEFLFKPPASYGPKTWNTNTDAGRYRRGLYTFRFRSVPYPSLQVFDTPDGSAPCVRRERSNTPLQALTLLNEPLFVECAKSLARETLEHGGDSDESRIEWAFRRCVARAPRAGDAEALKAFLVRQRDRLARGELQAAAILEPDNSNPELAAWTLAARVLLGMDETITRQ